MDVSQVTSNASLTSGVQATGGGHHHHHHKSITDQISQMGSAIDNAVSAGTLTSDQATSLKNELADITKTLGQASGATSATSTASGTASSSTTGQSNPLSQLSDADRKKVFSELQDVRKQLQAANSQSAAGSSASSGSDAVSKLFSQIDTNNDGTISKDELTQFLAQIGANALGYNANATSTTQTGGSSFSIFG